MMRLWRRVRTLATLVMVGILLLPATPASASSSDIKVYADGVAVSFTDVPPQIVEGRTMVPIRAVGEALGANVGWDGTKKSVVVTLDDTVVTFSVGDVKAKRNGDELAMQVPAQIIDGRTMVPLRFVSESLGALVGWDGDTRTVSITSAGKVARIENIVGTAAEVQRGSWDVWKWASVGTLKDDEKYLVEGGKLRTGAGTTAELVLADGSRIMLDPDSVIVITALTQDRTTRVRQSYFEVTRGSASVNVVKQVPTGSTFKIKVDGEEYVVRGTQFRIGKGKPLVVASGLVQATPAGEAASVFVPSGKVYDPAAATTEEKVKAISDEEQQALEDHKTFFVNSQTAVATEARKTKEALKEVVTALPSDDRNNELKKKAIEQFTQVQEKEATIQTDSNQAVSTIQATLAPTVMQALISGQNADNKFISELPKDPAAAAIVDDSLKNKFLTLQSDIMAKIRSTTEMAAEQKIITADTAKQIGDGAAVVQGEALKAAPPANSALAAASQAGWVPPPDWKAPKGKVPDGYVPPAGFVPPSGFDWSSVGGLKPGDVPPGWAKMEEAGWVNPIANANSDALSWVYTPMLPPASALSEGQPFEMGKPDGSFQPGGEGSVGAAGSGMVTGGLPPGMKPPITAPPTGPVFTPPADWKPADGYTPPPGWTPPVGWMPVSGEVPPGWAKAEEYGVPMRTTPPEMPGGTPATGTFPGGGATTGVFPGGGVPGSVFPGGIPGGTTPSGGTVPPGGTMPPGGNLPPTGTLPPGVTLPAGAGSGTPGNPFGTTSSGPAAPTALPGGGFTLPAGWYVGDGGVIFNPTGTATNYSLDTLLPGGASPGGTTGGTTGGTAVPNIPGTPGTPSVPSGTTGGATVPDIPGTPGTPSVPSGTTGGATVPDIPGMPGTPSVPSGTTGGSTPTTMPTYIPPTSGYPTSGYDPSSGFTPYVPTGP